MSVTLTPGATRGFTVSPVDAQGNPSKATLSGLSFTTSDNTVFSVIPDSASPNTRGIVTAGSPATNPDSAVLTATATATEPDGQTKESVSGMDTVTVASAPPPPPPPAPAASLVISWDAAPAR